MRPLVWLTEELDTEVLILAELGASPRRFLSKLNKLASVPYHWTFSINTRVHLFTRAPSDFFVAIRETPYISIRHIRLPAQPEFLLTMVHLPSQMFVDSPSRFGEISELATEIAEAEKSVGHKRTLVVGDFNVSPFEPALVSATGLHAVMTSTIAEKGSRTIRGRSYSFFYNPMWNLMGKESPGPPGSYFYRRSDHVSYFWNTFDQVLLRPDLLPYFDRKSLRFISEIGDSSLLTEAGVPNSTEYSDHLPLVFDLRLQLGD